MRLVLTLEALLLLGLGCGSEPGERTYELPGAVASSKYIDLRPATATANVCMDDKLAELDRFVDDIAAYLGVSAPSGRVNLVLDPRALRDPSTWPCPTLMSDCFVQNLRPGGATIFAEASAVEWGEFAGSQWHELVHAVDLSANGRSHWILQEGLAKYLGNHGHTEDVLGTFPDLFMESAAKHRPDPKGLDYAIALHFVGTLLERHGLESFGEFRRQIAEEASADDFAAAYRNVYAEALSQGLESMQEEPIYGQKVDVTCDGEEVSWQQVGEAFRAALVAECGDGWFYGGLGFDLVSGAPEDTAHYAKPFVVDVPEAGLYTMRLHGPSSPSYGQLRSCGSTPFGTLVAVDGGGSTAMLYPGGHEVLVGFPVGEPSEFTLELIFQGPSPDL